MKIPRYYHNDFDGLEGKKSTRKDDSTSSTSDIPELSDIKIESSVVEQNDEQISDKRRSAKQISTAKASSKKQSNIDRKTDDNLAEMNETNDNVEDPNEPDIIDVLAKEIKQEEIDFEYTDLSNSEDHNATI